MPIEKDATLKQQQSGLTIQTKRVVLAWDDAMAIATVNQPVPLLDMPLPSLKFDQPLPIADVAQSAPSRLYCAGLIPLPLTLQPYC